MMPKLEFYVVAESLSVDQSTNRLSLFNILEEASGFELPANSTYPPAVLPQVVAASSWLIDPADHGKQFRVTSRLHIPGKDTPVELGSTEFIAERRRQRILQVVLGCPVNTGEMRFEVLLDGEHKANHFVTVSMHEMPPQIAQEQVEPSLAKPSVASDSPR